MQTTTTTKIREAPFALRIVRRASGDAAIVYRRVAKGNQPDRLVNIGTLSPLPFVAGIALVRAALKSSGARPTPGPFLPLDHDWGARLALYARVAAGLREPERLARAADALQHAHGTEAAWWLGLIDRDPEGRARRSLRILIGATE